MSSRSYLFVPASRSDRFQEAIDSGADEVIMDLEDAIPPEEKDTARACLAEWLTQNPHARVAVRLNAADTAWFEHDLAVCGMPGVASVMVPKAAAPSDLQTVRRAAPGRALLPLIETAVGFEQAAAIARMAGVERLAFGSVDFQRDLGIEGDDDELLYFRCGLVLQSRLAGLAAPIDGVTVDIDDVAQLAADARRARRQGFGAKLCLHTLQLATVHQAFRPGADELAWARRVVDAAEHAGAAVLAAMDGRRVDEPEVLRARMLLARGCG